VHKEKIILEVCVDSVDSALIAQSGGAYRVEFCNSLSEGGITPSIAQIEIARKLLTIKFYVMIRPRGGDFLYNDIEFEIMKSDVRYCGTAGCDGVVFGILNANGSVDTKRCSELVQIAKNQNMEVTFHRAFDHCRDLFISMEDIIGIGCDRILTSGGRNTAIEGVDTIMQLVEKAGSRIGIMPGAGVTTDNVGDIIKITGARELHGTFRSHYPGKMTYKNISLGRGEEKYSTQYADIDKIKEVIRITNK
jgi:copper homeostasis protein